MLAIIKVLSENMHHMKEAKPVRIELTTRDCVPVLPLNYGYTNIAAEPATYTQYARTSQPT